KFNLFLFLLNLRILALPAEYVTQTVKQNDINGKSTRSFPLLPHFKCHDFSFNIKLQLNSLDFSLLCESGPPLLIGDKPLYCAPTSESSGYICPEGYWCHVGSSKTT